MKLARWLLCSIRWIDGGRGELVFLSAFRERRKNCWINKRFFCVREKKIRAKLERVKNPLFPSGCCRNLRGFFKAKSLCLRTIFRKRWVGWLRLLSLVILEVSNPSFLPLALDCTSNDVILHLSALALSRGNFPQNDRSKPRLKIIKRKKGSQIPPKKIIKSLFKRTFKYRLK